MLFIIFGQLGNVYLKTKDYFISKGFGYIQKCTYVPEDVIIPPSKFGERIYVSKEDMENCDFRYEVGKMTIGFNKEDIIDAMQGKKNCFLTVSASTLEFLVQIKTVYRDYVTTIFSYIDDTTLEYVYANEYDLDGEQLQNKRLIGKSLKNIYLKNIDFFDAVVIYGGENSLFDINALLLQYDTIISKSILKQQLSENANFVELPYQGSDPFIFVSYSHDDAERVLPVLYELRRRGFRIWYDKGIKGGENWRKLLAMKVADCYCFMLFSSENNVHSVHVKAELNAAFSCLEKKMKKILTVRLDKAVFDLEYEMYLQTFQNVDISREDFMDFLCDSLGDEMREI